jgi:TonB family protein
MEYMSQNWREWEGRTVDGKFVLANYLGGAHGSGVFRTRLRPDDSPTSEGEDAAIKLVPISGAEADTRLRRWQAARQLSHPNLIRILATGRATVDGKEVAYVIEEFAEENLAQILPERALTRDEVRAMLGPVIGALEYVHGKDMAHGRMKPSNIMAVQDQVKVSSDDLCRTGEIPLTTSLYDAPEAGEGVSSASDVWSLGMTLVEILTQRMPAWDPPRMNPPEVSNDIPEPFRGIAKSCLELDPAKRCGLAEIRQRLEGRAASGVVAMKGAPVAVAAGKSSPANKVRVVGTASERPRGAKWRYVLAVVALIAVVVFLILRPRSLNGPGSGRDTPPASSTVSPTEQTTPAKANDTQPGAGQTHAAAESFPALDATRPGQSSTPGDAGPVGNVKTAGADKVVERVMPKVSSSAQRSITGKIKVRVRVKTDADGNVSQATLKEAGPSKYFARIALEAAKRWKFSPGEDDNGIITFVFSRARTEASISRSR